MADPLAVTVPLLPPQQCTAAPAPTTTEKEHAATTEVHRMWLHTELIRAGVPPQPDDPRTIGQLAELDQEIVEAVVRWIGQSARWWAAPAAPPEAATEPLGVDRPPDPRLTAW